MTTVRAAISVLLALTLLVGCGGPGDPATAAPTPPGDVVAAPGPGYVTVTWTDRSDDEAGFVVYREPVTDAALASQQVVEVGRVGPDVTTFIDHSADVGATNRFTVGALGEDGAVSEAASAGEPVTIVRGIDLVVGTLNRRGDFPTGTATIAYYVFPPEELEGQDFALTITGPPGWRDDVPVVFEEDEEGSEDRWRSLSILNGEAVVGTYRAEVTLGGTTYTATAELTDIDYELPGPTEITPVEASTSSVTATWQAPDAARSFLAGLWTGDFGSLVTPYEYATELSHTLADLSLAPGSYRFEVVAFATDLTQPMPPKVAPYGVSYDSSEPFDVGLVEIAGTWSTTLAATASTCEIIPVGTTVAADVLFEVDGDAITATSELGAVSTGTRDGNVVTLTRSDETEGGEPYEVLSISTFGDDAFEGESVYTLDSGCVITWDFTGTRANGE